MFLPNALESPPIPLNIADPTIVQAVVRELVAAAAGTLQIHQRGNIRYKLRPGELLQYRCCAWLPPGTARPKVEEYCQEWRGVVVREKTEEGFLLERNRPWGLSEQLRPGLRWSRGGYCRDRAACSASTHSATILFVSQVGVAHDRVGVSNVVRSVPPFRCRTAM